MGQSLLQEGGTGHTGMPCWAGYFLLDYKKGDRPQPYSCPQVASSEACLTALGIKIQIINCLVHGAQGKMNIQLFVHFVKWTSGVEHMGIGALRQHASFNKHRRLSGVSKEEKPKEQLSLSSFFVKKEKTEALPKKCVDLQESTVNTEWTFKQSVTKAEIIATLQFADQNTPFASADNLGPCYREQFTDSRIAQNVAIGAKKMSYLVGYGLGPYFTKLTVSNLVAGNSFFTLHFDETVTAQKKKQIDLLVQFWSDIHNEVKVKYLTSIMFGHAKAVEVVTEIMQVLENLSLPFKLMLSLGMDGPNVNKSILAKLNELKKEKGYPELVQCPQSCLIHVCHNSF